jgi:hypothetical protein
LTGKNLAFFPFEVLCNMTPRPLFLTALKSLFLATLMLVMSTSVQAQSRWSSAQSSMYPYVDSMLLTRHEQTVLLGEGAQQTGIFYATLPEAFSEQVQHQLIGDGLTKNWRLHSLMRLGTSYMVTMTQDERILDIRLTNTNAGVDAVYSILLNQNSGRTQTTASASSQ